MFGWKKTGEGEHRPPLPKDPRVERLVSNLKPSSVLLDLTVNRPAYEKHFRDGRIIAEIYLDRTGAMPSVAEREELEAKRDEIQQLCEADEDFQAAARRLEGAGVKVEFGGQGDYCGEFNVLRLRGTIKSLSTVEALAADDAGYRSRTERAAAAERFRIFMLRNYDSGWSANRERYPDVGGSPYADPSTWPKKT